MSFHIAQASNVLKAPVTMVNTPIIRFIFVSIASLLGVEAAQQGDVSHAESTEVNLSTYSFSWKMQRVTGMDWISNLYFECVSPLD